MLIATRLFHAATEQDWDARSASHYEPAGYAEEGFVHLSTEDQMIGTLHKHYLGRDDLLVLTIAPTLLANQPIFEDLYGSGTEFPHVYGPLELAAITNVAPLPCDEHGRFDGWRPSP